MSGFFLSWQLWEQMTFCLGCAMVIIVAAALIRNLWDWWNLRKHVRILKEQQAEQAKLLQMHPSVRKRQLNSQVPFGVRAIQSGIEVEGVWISRPNSVFNSPSNTSPASPAVEPKRLVGDKLVPPSRTYDDPQNPVAGAARQLEMQTLGGRNIPPRAARDPFGDSAAASAKSARSEKSDTDSQYTRRSVAELNAYRDVPDEEAGYSPAVGPASKGKQSRRQSQLYQTENAYPLDYFSMPTNQPQAYIPTGRTNPKQRNNTHNTYVPPEVYQPGHSRRSSAMGYSYPQGYSQAHVQSASPIEIDLGESYGGSFPRPVHQAGPSQASFEPAPRRDNRNSSYHMVFSNQAQGGASSGTAPRATPPPPQEPLDPFATPGATPGAVSTPGRSVHQPLLGEPVGQAIEMPAYEPRDRAEAEAEASKMRRVNEGFSVAKQGQRRDRQSLDAAAVHAQSQSTAQREGEGRSRKKLQKKERKPNLNAERRPSQFKENI